MQSIESIWKRIEAWFAGVQASEALSHFQSGATDEDIQTVEAALGITFPGEVKTSYRIHNGSNRQMLLGDPDQRLLELCSLDEVVSYLSMLKQYAAGWKLDLAKDDWCDRDGLPILIRPQSWHLRWIPLLTSNGTMVCLDLAPTPHGEMGQMIRNDPEEGTTWLASSWQEFLLTFADDLEAGTYSYEEGRLKWS